ncbi:MAG: flagellar basal body-associated FliL family protein [Armatimonadetes bacterium]|nr:flagellar basal body-associated FliL family protein [Armatimonadota bacterium]
MAQEPQGAAEAAAAPAAAPAKKKSPLPIVIATALLVGPLAFGLFTFKQGAARKKEALVEKWEKTAPKVPASFALETITVNMADGDRYCRFTPVLYFEFDVVDAKFFKSKAASLTPGSEEKKSGGEGHGEGGKKAEAKDPTVPKTEPSKAVTTLVEELPQCLAELKDSAINLVSSQNFEELSKLKGKEHLKKELAERFTVIVEQVLEEAKLETKFEVKKVLFSDFIMQ